jgi:hypothetical protein
MESLRLLGIRGPRDRKPAVVLSDMFGTIGWPKDISRHLVPARPVAITLSAAAVAETSTAEVHGVGDATGLVTRFSKRYFPERRHRRYGAWSWDTGARGKSSGIGSTDRL